MIDGEKLARLINTCTVAMIVIEDSVRDRIAVEDAKFLDDELAGIDGERAVMEADPKELMDWLSALRERYC